MSDQTSEQNVAADKLTEIIINAMTHGPAIFGSTTQLLPKCTGGTTELYMTAAAAYVHLEFQIYKMLHEAGIDIPSLEAFRFAVLSMVLGCEYGQEKGSRELIESMYGSITSKTTIENILAHVDNARDSGKLETAKTDKDAAIADIVSRFRTTWKEYLHDKSERRS